MSKNKSFFLFLLVLLPAVYLSLTQFSKAFWCDEAYTSYISHKSFAEIIELTKNDSGMPLYYFFTKIWILIFGYSEFSLRSSSLLFFILFTAVFYRLSLSIFKKQDAALFSTFVYSFSQINVIQSSTARMYPLLTLITLLAAYYFIKIMIEDKGTGKDHVILSVLHLIGLFTHTWYMFVIFSQCIFLFLLGFKRIKQYAWILIIPVVLFAIIWLKILIGQTGNDSVKWLTFSADSLKYMFRYFYYLRTETLIKYVVFAFAVQAVIVVFTKQRFFYKETLASLDDRKKHLAFVFVSFIIILGIPSIISIYKPVLYPERQPIIILPFLLLCTVSVLYLFSNRTLIFTLMFLFCGVVYLNNFYYQEHDIFNPRGIMRIISHDVSDKDTFVCPRVSRLEYEYYFKRYSDKKTMFISYPREIDSHPGWYHLKENDFSVDSFSKGLGDSILKAGSKQGKLWLIDYRNDNTDKPIFEFLRTKLRITKHLKFKDREVIVFGM